MKLHVVSVVHMEPALMGSAFGQFLRTADLKKYPHSWVVVDHHWPIRKDNFSFCVAMIAKSVGASVISPEKNLGGHGGVSFALNHISADADDAILVYDPDSYPVTNGWCQAMMDVLSADPKMGYISLMDDRIEKNRAWSYEAIGGKKCAFHSWPDMIGVTMFRPSALAKGLLADTPFYGNVETAMDAHVRKLGMRRCYLYDYREMKNPIPHPEIYLRWKIAHGAASYKGNFDQWVSEGRT